LQPAIYFANKFSLCYQQRCMTFLSHTHTHTHTHTLVIWPLITLDCSVELVYVSLSVRFHISETTSSNLNFSPDFRCILARPASMGRNTSLRILPVLWITSCFHIVDSVMRVAIATASFTTASCMLYASAACIIIYGIWVASSPQGRFWGLYFLEGAVGWP